MQGCVPATTEVAGRGECSDTKSSAGVAPPGVGEDEEEMNTEKLTADKLQAMILVTISQKMLDMGLEGPRSSMVIDWASQSAARQVDQFLRPMTDTMRMRFSVLATYDVLESERVPVDWWQSMRQRWAPRWWLARHPVRERVIATKVQFVCPHLPIGRACGEHAHFEFLKKGTVL